MRLHFIRTDLTCPRLIAGKSTRVIQLLGNLNVLDDYRCILAIPQTHARQGAVVVPQWLNQLDSCDLVGLGQGEDTGAEVFLHRAGLLG